MTLAVSVQQAVDVTGVNCQKGCVEHPPANTLLPAERWASASAMLVASTWSSNPVAQLRTMTAASNSVLDILNRARVERWERLALGSAELDWHILLRDGWSTDEIFIIGEQSIDFDLLAKCSSLTRLALRRLGTQADGVKACSQLPFLTYLDLTGNNLGPGDTGPLVNASGLIHLNLNGNFIEDDGTEPLAALTQLTYLSLDGNSIGSRGARALGNLTALRYLELHDNWLIGPDGVEALADLTDLEYLGLHSAQIGNEGLRSLRLLDKLRALDLSGTRLVGAGVDSLSSLSSLERLELSLNQLGDEGAATLVSLKIFESLRHLNLQYNQIGDLGFEKLFGAWLERDCAIERIYIDERECSIPVSMFALHDAQELLTAYRVRRPLDGPRGTGATPPRVFISYSHDSEQHRARVLHLAQKLRDDGVDAWLDRFEPAPPQGWPRWMIEQIVAADYVVLVCSKAFRRRFERGDMGGNRRGATFEGLLCAQLIHDGDLDYERVVPVKFEGTVDEMIPLVCRPATYHTLPDEYEDLYKRLTGKLASKPNRLGKRDKESEGLPKSLNAADQLSLAQDELERCMVEGEGTARATLRIIELRRRIREGPMLQEGDILANRYRLVDQAGTGGFATVWRAYDRRRKQIVAVKVLHGQWSEDRSRIERFQSGARRMESLRHEAIVPILEAEGVDDRYYFHVMQWLAGGNLEEAVIGGRIETTLALQALTRVLDALDFAHHHGVVHRDVKPANVLLDDRGRGWITDFDLAHAKTSTQGTRTGGLGTFVYAAPEQHENAKTVGPASDLYSAGMCVLFVLLGKDPPPFVAAVQPGLLRGLMCGARLREALARAVAYEAAERGTSCQELRAAIVDEVG